MATAAAVAAAAAVVFGLKRRREGGGDGNSGDKSFPARANTPFRVRPQCSNARYMYYTGTSACICPAASQCVYASLCVRARKRA